MRQLLDSIFGHISDSIRINSRRYAVVLVTLLGVRNRVQVEGFRFGNFMVRRKKQLPLLEVV